MFALFGLLAERGCGEACDEPSTSVLDDHGSWVWGAQLPVVLLASIALVAGVQLIFRRQEALGLKLIVFFSVVAALWTWIFLGEFKGFS